jgi:UDP-arabinose 4-epimerase
MQMAAHHHTQTLAEWRARRQRGNGLVHLVNDLAQAHLLALNYLAGGGNSLAVNLSTGQPVSIREVLDTIARVTRRPVPIEWGARRPGDPPTLYAVPALAREVLGFSPQYSDLETIIRTAAPCFGLEADG